MPSLTLKWLLGSIALLLCLPMPAMVMLHDRGKLSPWLGWIANRTLAGVTVVQDAPALSLPSWLSGKYQEGATRRFDENFGGRELLIRVNNQLLWSGFGKSYMADEMIILGKNHDLFSADYLHFREGFGNTPTDEYLEDLAVKASALQSRLAAAGVAFAILFTPDKTSFYPQDIPDRYRPLVPGAPVPPPYIDRLIATLTRFSVSYVDGRAVTRQVSARATWTVFPRTGLHWNELTAFQTTEALLRKLADTSGRPFPEIAATNIRRSTIPGGADADLATLLNLLWVPGGKYFHADYSSQQASAGAITFVGGSFVDALDSVLDESKAFARISHYHYFKVNVQRFPGGALEPVDVNKIPWREDFLSAKAVVLEINPLYLTGRHPMTFLDAALAATRNAAPTPKAIPPVVVELTPPDWYGEEHALGDRWVWARGTASLVLDNPGDTARLVRLRFNLGVLTERTVRLLGPDGFELYHRKIAALQRAGPASVRLLLKPGKTALRFENDRPGVPPGGADVRLLGFQLLNFEVVPDEY